MDGGFVVVVFNHCGGFVLLFSLGLFFYFLFILVILLFSLGEMCHCVSAAGAEYGCSTGYRGYFSGLVVTVSGALRSFVAHHVVSVVVHNFLSFYVICFV